MLARILIPPLAKGRVALGARQGSGGDRPRLSSILTDPHPALPFARGGITRLVLEPSKHLEAGQCRHMR